MEYKLEYQHTYDTMVALNRLYRKVRLRWLNIVCRVALCVCGGAMLYLAFYQANWLGWDGTAVFYVFLGLLFVAAGLFMDYLNGLMSKMLAVKGIGAITITVNDEGVFAKTAKTEEKYFFTAATALYKSRGVYYMFIDKRHSIMFPEDGFTEGDPASFGDYLAEKCAMAVKTIK